MMNESIDTVFRSIENHILTILQSSSFKEKCKRIKGETACLLCVRKDYIWWLSIGDCLVYVFHDELHN